MSGSLIANMPLTIASVFNFVPINLWQPLKKFVTKDQLVVFDLPFKMSTKYTPGLLIVLMCLSFANQFVRNIELSCSTNGFGGRGNSHNGYAPNSDDEKELNDFCWNYETFLVAKALEPNMRGMVTFPGVSGYNKGTDEVLRQRYYKYVWLILGKLTVITFLPYFFWKARGVKKIKPLVAIADSPEYSEEDQRLTYFLETIGFNGSFGWYYVACKILATLSPFAQWYYLCGFLGQRYKYYGVDVLRHFIGEAAPWPDPMDALFPKMAKCEWSRYGYAGDMEVKSAQCQMPMNNITQWSFFVYWFWIAVVFAVNLLSLLYLFFHILPSCRRYKYRKFVGAACREDVEKLLNYTARGWNGKEVKKQHGKNKVIYINIGFGDWLVLSFIKKNLEEWKFRDFIRQIATTENTIIQLKPVTKPVPLTVPPFNTSDEKNIQKNPDEQSIINQNHENGFKNSIINQNHEIGFKQSIMNQDSNITHPSDTAFQPGSTGFELPLSPMSPLFQEQPVKITAPVKIDRKNLNKQHKMPVGMNPLGMNPVGMNPVGMSAKAGNKKNAEYGWKAPGSSKNHPPPQGHDPYFGWKG